MYENIIDTIGFVQQADPEVGDAMAKELARQKRNLELIASENIVSPAVMAAMGSVLTNKYAEGYPGKRYYGGCEDVDIVETIAIERAKKLFGAKYANVQAHSGAQANTAVYVALLRLCCIRHTIIKIPRIWIEAALAVMGTARDEERYSYALAVGYITVFYFTVPHYR